jgi:hypothetical protein
VLHARLKKDKYEFFHSFVMSIVTLPEILIQKIREEVLKSKSRWRVAIDMGINFSLVDFYTKDLPYKRRAGPCIYGKAFTLLQQLLSTGVVPSNQETHDIMRTLRRHLPMIQYARYGNKAVFYLEDRNKAALQSVLDRSQSRIVSYHDLGEMLRIFSIEADSGEKKAFLGKKKRSSAKKKHGSHTDATGENDGFFGRIWHSDVLSHPFPVAHKRIWRESGRKTRLLKSLCHALILAFFSTFFSFGAMTTRQYDSVGCALKYWRWYSSAG